MRTPRRLPLLLAASLLASGFAVGPNGAASAHEALDVDAGAMIIVTAARDPGYLAARIC